MNEPPTSNWYLVGVMIFALYMTAKGRTSMEESRPNDPPIERIKRNALFWVSLLIFAARLMFLMLSLANTNR
jgi:hypothetical protein